MLTPVAFSLRNNCKRFGLTLLLCLSLLCLGLVHTAHAHKLYMFTSVEGAYVQGRVYFSASAPLRSGNVLVKNDQGELLTKIKSDMAGKFSLQIAQLFPANGSAYSGKLHITCQTIDGHKAERIIDLAGLAHKYNDESSYLKPQKLAGGAVQDNTKMSDAASARSEDLRRVIAAELRPLKEQIDLLSNKIWLRDILGGLGVLFGAFGIWMFLISNRRLAEARRLHRSETLVNDTAALHDPASSDRLRGTK